MSIYVIAKIIHIITMLFFVGVVSFRTFIMPVLQDKYDKHTYLNIDKLISLKARSIIKINNMFLILSGLYLFSLHVNNINMMILFKVSIGLLLACTFYIVPFIMKKTNHVKWFSRFFHYLFFSLMMIVIILSQLIFT